jgi:uncharacterized membrane protein YidH (DUF202 family)
MCPEIEIRELNERQQLRRLRIGVICIWTGFLIGGLGIGLGFHLGSTHVDPVTLSNALLIPLGLGILAIIVGVYQFLRGRGKTKRQCRRLLTRAAIALFGVIVIVGIIVGAVIIGRPLLF